MADRSGADRRRAVRALAAAGAVVALAGCSARVDVPSAPVATSAPPSPAVNATPDERSTGVPAGTVLKASKGLTIDEEGAEVEGLDVDGCVRVLADDVTIRNTRIRCDDASRTMVVEVGDDADGLVVVDSEISGEGKVEVGVGWSRYTLRRVDVHSVNDGARFGHQVTIEDSWIHDMTRIGELHPDALQTTSASEVVIRGNVLDPTNTESGDLGNAGLMLGSETGTKEVRDVVVEDNTFDGGNYSLNIRGDITAEDVVIRGNTFGRDTRYGEVLGPKSVPLGPGNTVGGEPVDPDIAEAG